MANVPRSFQIYKIGLSVKRLVYNFYRFTTAVERIAQFHIF